MDKDEDTVDTEKEPKAPKPSMSYVLDRRVSQAEMLRRQTWLQTARSSQAIRPKAVRCREHYKIQFPEDYGGLYIARFSPNGNVLVTGFGFGIIQVRDPDTGALKATLRSSLDTNMPVMGCRFHPRHFNTFYVACADGVILQCDAEHCEMFRFAVEEDNQVNALDLSPDGKVMVTGGQDTVVRVYDLETRQVVKEYRRSMLDQTDDIRFHTMKIFAIRVHSTMENIFVSGGWDSALKIWDLRVGEGCVGKIRGPHISGDAIDLKTNMVLTGSWVQKHSLQLWDLRTYQLMKDLSPVNRPPPISGEFLYSAHFFDGDPYGNTVVTAGSGLKAVEVISISDRLMMGKFTAPKPIYTADSYSHMLAFGGMEACLYIGSFS